MFISLDHRWRLDFNDLDDDDDMYISLRHLTNREIAVMFSLCVIDCEGILLMRSKDKLFLSNGKAAYDSLHHLYLKWSKVHEAIRKGGLIRKEIRMKLAETNTSSAVSPIIPTNSSACKVI